MYFWGRVGFKVGYRPQFLCIDPTRQLVHGKNPAGLIGPSSYTFGNWANLIGLGHCDLKMTLVKVQAVTQIKFGTSGLNLCMP